MPSTNSSNNQPNSQPSSPHNTHTDPSSNSHPSNSHTDLSFNFDPSSNVYHTDSSGNIDLSGNYSVHFTIDASADFIVTTSNVYSFDISGQDTDTDASGNDPDCSLNNMYVPPIVTFSENKTYIDASGFQFTIQQGQSVDGSQITKEHVVTVDPSLNPQIEETLSQIVTTYNDEVGSTNDILNEIKMYANEIQCEDFQGKGTIDDYTALFTAAAKIANESKHIELDVDIEGFNEFANAADELAALFNGFILKLQNVNIIDDSNFLKAIASALKKIVNLSNVFGKFKETILATSTIQIPKSAHDTAVVISGVMDEITCAMGYIGYFVDASASKPIGAELTASEKGVISKAIDTIDSWNVLCEQGLSITMSNNVDISFIKHSSDELKTTTSTLVNATNALKTKLAKFHYC